MIHIQKSYDFLVFLPIDVAGKVPFDSIVTKAMVSESPVVEYSPKSRVSHEISEMWKDILNKV